MDARPESREEKSMKFADRYPLERFLELSKLNGDAQQKHIDEHAIPAAMMHLRDVRADGLMSLVEGSNGRRIEIVDAWNAFVTYGDPTNRVLSWSMGFAFSLGLITARMASKGGSDAITPQGATEAYHGICEAFDRGNMRYETRGARFRFGSAYDRVSGLECELVVAGWKASIVAFDMTTMKTVVLKDAPLLPLRHLEIDVPTGELLMADWFRIDAFTKAVDERLDAHLEANDADADGEEINYSIASDVGAMNLAEAYLKSCGIVQIATDNTTVMIDAAEDGRSLVGSESWFPGKRTKHDEAPKGHVRAGRICCDRHTVMIGERTRVLELLAEGGDADPAATLDAYLADHAYVAVLKVEPGRWRIDFGPKFHKRANRRRLGIPAGTSPWFSMQRIGDL
jgi:hypothetical protein